ncbi:DUF4097 family beta strand repeat-containing protein [Croceitalea rosinachiae]|uniref:DUF4097 family beta strand repeat-containing protein n=1 Tax=Croceitalea rosinachiae TaxID=3075596 RepID=A0ABU3A833_9FLAO|nr:DUF4097 family beta strand repeat-containing protein [Croceitalea sp. F388]MDT0605717.1 DUF4097 family beta strand repeat-containing protein [Croceitalea sp. F388]
MKLFKSIIITAIMLLSVNAMAQEESVDLFSVPLSNPNQPGKLIVNQLTGSIDVVAYEGKEVVVKAVIGQDDDCDSCHKKGSNSNGMKKISNASLNIGAEEKDNVIEIENELWNRKTDLSIKVPKNFSLKLSTVNHGDINVSGVNGDMEISNVNGEITLEKVSGSASVDTTNGEVKVSFENITSDSDMAFSSFNGNVEVTFPSSLRANVKAKSDMGDVYTDFDMAVAKNEPEVEKGSSSGKYKVKIEQWVKGTINGGGPEMLFKTFNGDIMIKSKQN